MGLGGGREEAERSQAVIVRWVVLEMTGAPPSPKASAFRFAAAGDGHLSDLQEPAKCGASPAVRRCCVNRHFFPLERR